MSPTKRKWKVTFTDQALKDIAAAPDNIKKESSEAIKKIQENPYVGERVAGRLVRTREARRRRIRKCDMKDCTNRAYRDVYWIVNEEARAEVSKGILDQITLPNQTSQLARRLSSPSSSSRIQREFGRRIMMEGEMRTALGAPMPKTLRRGEGQLCPAMVAPSNGTGITNDCQLTQRRRKCGRDRLHIMSQPACLQHRMFAIQRAFSMPVLWFEIYGTCNQ